MELDQLDATKIRYGIIGVLERNDLCGGKIRNIFDVSYGELSEHPGWRWVGAAQSPLITVDDEAAVSLFSSSALLSWEPTEGAVASWVDELLLDDALERVSILVSSPDAAFERLGDAVAMLISQQAWYRVPAWALAPSAPPIFTTAALPGDEVILFHPTPKARYLVEPVVDLVRGRGSADVRVGAVVAKPAEQLRVPVTRCKLV